MNLNPKKTTVLLVDDEAMVRGVARRMLEMGGYNVLEAASAGQALEVFQKHKGVIQLLVSDIQMPGLSGVELATRMEQERPGIRILFITGFAGAHEARLRHPVLGKPFTKDDLLFKVAEILDDDS